MNIQELQKQGRKKIENNKERNKINFGWVVGKFI